MSSLLRATDAPRRILEHVGSLAPGLSISPLGDVAAGSVRVIPADQEQAHLLAREGIATLPDAIPREETNAALIRGIGSLIDAALPAVFIYLFDEVWRIGDALRARVSALLGRPYALAEDGWAWQVERGREGWAPHRDDDRVLDRAAPERVNVWVALTDTTADRSCIHVVPLEQDEHYPNALDRDEARAASVRQLPVGARTGLVWNANLLHWGGRCASDAAGPRVAISFTLIRADAAERMGFPLVDLAEHSPERRVDTVAKWIAGYGPKGLPDVSDEIRSWAKATCALQNALARISSKTP